MAEKSKSKRALGTWIRMLKAHNMIFRQVRRRMNGTCSIAQFDVLAQLNREKNGTPLAELSRRLLVTAGNITGLIDRMEAAGLVTRKRDVRDRRVIRVHLTEKGKALSARMIPKHARDVEQILSSFPEKDLQQLRSLLEKLIHNLETAETRGSQ